MSDQAPDFVILSDSQEAANEAARDLNSWWNSISQPQKNDYLSSWDELVYNEHARVGNYDLKCIGSYQALGYVRFQIVLH